MRQRRLLGGAKGGGHGVRKNLAIGGTQQRSTCGSQPVQHGGIGMYITAGDQVFDRQRITAALGQTDAHLPQQSRQRVRMDLGSDRSLGINMHSGIKSSRNHGQPWVAGDKRLACILTPMRRLAPYLGTAAEWGVLEGARGCSAFDEIRSIWFCRTGLRVRIRKRAGFAAQNAPASSRLLFCHSGLLRALQLRCQSRPSMRAIILGLACAALHPLCQHLLASPFQPSFAQLTPS
jgi:hypothetical protein